MGSSDVDVAIVGAGPYGLSLATHLTARNVEHRIFGTPMETWSRMPPGMCLKSLGFATNIFTPDGEPTLPDYCAERGLEGYEPIDIATFEQYGSFVQKTRVPYLEQIDVTALRRAGDRFEMTLETGETFGARRVVLGIGLRYFAHLPAPLNGLPPELLSHTADRRDYAELAGRDVIVVGRGQSALEAAALLHEQGANVELLARQPIIWGTKGKPDSERGFIDRVRVPTTMLGGGRDNWVLQHVPLLMHYAPTKRRLEFTQKHLGPAGAWWLRDRFEGRVRVSVNMTIAAVSVSGDKARLTLSCDEGPREILADYVVAGTGYKVDLDRIAFLDPRLAASLTRLEKSPKLTRHFESSVPGLYFLGLASAASFGPFFRFVAGSSYAAPALARRLAA